MNIFFLSGLVFLIFIAWLIFKIIFTLKNIGKTSFHGDCVKTLIFLGSGGHTGEILKIVDKLDFKKYSPRFYVVATTDKISSQKAEKIEISKNPAPDSLSNYFIHYIPRSREVGQSWISTVGTTFYSLLWSIRLVFLLKPDLILCNGPGSCVPICAVSFMFKVFGISSARIIFIESICRVKSLSLSGRILYHFCDDIFVQWSNLKEKYPKVKYFGRLV